MYCKWNVGIAPKDRADIMLVDKIKRLSFIIQIVHKVSKQVYIRNVSKEI